MTALSPQVSSPTYPSSDGEPVAATFVFVYARLEWRLAVEGNHYRQQFGELPPAQ
ncbi:MAG: hypothetical protein O3A14_03525 [Cyanobacteria bacterium]|nr:hypothetical protein [Cyanobacteriota bacterium]